MEIKSYNHQSIAYWSNSRVHSELLSCAQMNPDQNGMYNLDILSLDFSDRSKNVNIIGNAFYNTPFRCLAWDTFGYKENRFSHGIIFGGMEDGSYTLWNVAEMINGYNRNPLEKTEDNIENQAAFLYGEYAEEDSYPIMCAEWNSLKNNYLAFGSTDLLILDIGKDISNPYIKKPGDRNPHEGSYITSVSWNKEVSNVLASASYNGQIALWDIKINKSVFEFRDSPSSNVYNRNVVICWSKTISTQLAVTLDDEKRNELQIWDLRNKKGPVAVFDRGHTKGINTMQWCETDPDLILTGGRDNRIVCWNYTQEEGPISILDLGRPVFDLKWSKKLRSIYSLSLYDKTYIYTMDNTNLFSYVPKWFRVPIYSSFWANESLMKYSEGYGQKLTEIKLPNIQIAYKETIRSLLNELYYVLNYDQGQSKGKEGYFWNLISIKNGNQGDEGIYDYLGFNREKIIKEVEKYTGKKRYRLNAKTETQTKHKQKVYTPVVGQEAASFFASIGYNQVNNLGINAEEDDYNESVKYDMVPRNFNWNIGKYRVIKHNILIGNYEGAIDAALKCGRTAEALIIAYSLDQNAFNSTLKTFFTETTDNFITDILKNITYQDHEELVRKYDLENWKYCVAMIYSLSTSYKRKNLLNLLASRIREYSLKKTGRASDDILPEDNPAILCYVLSENFNEIANLYFDNLKHFYSGTNQRKEVVLEYAKRLILIYSTLTIYIQPSKSFHKIIREAAFIATEYNFKMVAYNMFRSYIYESSVKETDMIIHATKNLEEYRNSIVFKQINLPIMQTQQGQGQKGKKPSMYQQGPPKLGQHSNPNVPTKDKNIPRPPIFNKREYEHDMGKPVTMVPPQPQNRGRNQIPVYAEEVPEYQPNIKKNAPKKAPPPPGFKSQQSGFQQQHQQQQFPHQHPQQFNQQQSGSQYYQDESHLYQFDRKNVQGPTKSKKVPPPPPTQQQNFMNEPRDQQGQVYHSQYLKKLLPPPKMGYSVRMQPPQVQQYNRIPPPPVQQYNRIPPPVNSRSMKPSLPSFQQKYYSHQEYEYQQPSGRVQRIQEQQNVQEQRGTRPPPPGMSKPPVLKQSTERDEQNMSFQSNRVPETQSYNKPPYFHSAKKTIPPPPPGKKDIPTYEYEPETVSRTKLDVVKPPPPGKMGGKVPPPPPKVEPPQVMKNQQQFPQQHQFPQQQQFSQPQHYAQQQHPQQFNQQQFQSSQQPHEESAQNQPQYYAPVIKRPPPPVSGKKGPPPPPRR